MSAQEHNLPEFRSEAPPESDTAVA
jgi:hypothetical protein